MNNYPRIFLPSGSSSRSWYTELQFKGERRKICLDTLDRDLALIRAVERRCFVKTCGWKDYRIEYEPVNLTVGEYWGLFEKKRHDLSSKTFRQYRNALNLAVSEIMQFPDDTGKYGRKRSRRARKRQELIDAVKLASLTPNRCEAWKALSLAKRGSINTRTYLQSLKAIFGTECIRVLGFDLAHPLPFLTVAYEKESPQKYLSNLNHRILIEHAKVELKDQDPEVFKAFLLGEFEGLKAGEIDRLEWKAFLWDQNRLHIEGRQAANLPIEPGVKSEFRDFHRKATGDFVIESARNLRPDVSYNYYRCEEVLDRLRKWLAAQGAGGKKLLETLRKEFGSQVCRARGIYAASEAMRHKNIRTTEQCIANPVEATTGLGHLLG